MPAPSNQIKDLKGQPMFQILSLSQELERKGREIFHFELGDPDFNSPINVINAAIDSLKKGNTHYQPSRGSNEFLESIQDTTSISRHFIPNKSQINVTTGANAAIFYSFKSIFELGDELLLPNPYFPSYIAAAQLSGAKTKFYPLNSKNNFKPDLEIMESKITSKTKALLINSPSNPTGAVFSEKIIRGIYNLCEKYDLYLISDEVYSRMIYDENESFFSPGTLDECKHRTIIINGFSKSFAMTGWRVGVVISPENISEKITLISESIVSCVPGFVQDAAKEALLSPKSITQKMSSTLRSRQQSICNQLNSVSNINCKMPQGSIYVFPNIKKITNSSEKFAFHLLEKTGLACVPGSYFGSEGEGYLRFSSASNAKHIELIGPLLNKAINTF